MHNIVRVETPQGNLYVDGVNEVNGNFRELPSLTPNRERALRFQTRDQAVMTMGVINFLVTNNILKLHVNGIVID